MDDRRFVEKSVLDYSIVDSIDIKLLYPRVSMMKRKKGFFSISAVAKMFSVHQQTIRLYEKEGLICPNRSAGNTRLFSEEDVDRLEEVIHLTHELGINLAGVEMILKLKKQMKKMQADMNKLFEQTQKDLEEEVEVSKVSIKQNAKQLADIKKTALEKRNTAPTTDIVAAPAKKKKAAKEEQSQIFDLDSWEIDYEQE